MCGVSRKPLIGVDKEQMGALLGKGRLYKFKPRSWEDRTAYPHWLHALITVAHYGRRHQVPHHIAEAHAELLRPYTLTRYTYEDIQLPLKSRDHCFFL